MVDGVPSFQFGWRDPFSLVTEFSVQEIDEVLDDLARTLSAAKDQNKLAVKKKQYSGARQSWYK